MEAPFDFSATRLQNFGKTNTRMQCHYVNSGQLGRHLNWKARTLKRKNARYVSAKESFFSNDSGSDEIGNLDTLLMLASSQSGCLGNYSVFTVQVRLSLSFQSCHSVAAYFCSIFSKKIPQPLCRPIQVHREHRENVKYPFKTPLVRQSYKVEFRRFRHSLPWLLFRI